MTSNNDERERPHDRGQSIYDLHLPRAEIRDRISYHLWMSKKGDDIDQARHTGMAEYYARSLGGDVQHILEKAGRVDPSKTAQRRIRK